MAEALQAVPSPDKPTRKAMDPAKLEAAAKKQKVRRAIEQLKSAKDDDDLKRMMAERLDRKIEPAAVATTTAAPAAPAPEEKKEQGIPVAMAVGMFWQSIAPELHGTPFAIDEHQEFQVGTNDDGSPIVAKMTKQDILVQTEVPLVEKWAKGADIPPEWLALGGLLLCFGPPAVKAVKGKLEKQAEAKKQAAATKAPAPEVKK